MLEHGFIDITKLMHCGVYALLKKGEVVYIGRSRQPLMRIYRHVFNRGKRLGISINTQSNAKCPTANGKGISFDGAWFLPCMLGQLSVLEVHFIKMFAPKYNVLHNPDLKPKPTPKEPTQIMPIPEEMKELLRQIVVITDIPPEPVAPQRAYITRRL